MIKGITSIAVSALLSACAPTSTTFIASEPIPVSSSPLEERVPVQYKEGVQRVLEIRQFAIDSLGFHKNSKHYTWFTEEQDHQHTVSLLSITGRTTLPISRAAKAEKLHLDGLYREDIAGFLYLESEKDPLTDEQEYYNRQGYDTYWRAVTSYHSTGEGLGSPITPDFLKSDFANQVEIAVHEMCHENVEHNIGPGFSDELDDSFCTLVGYAARVEYFSQKNLDEKRDAAKDSFNELTAFAQKFNQIYGKLTELYRQDLPIEEKMKQRERLFAEIQPFRSMEANNASLWSWHPYLVHHSLMNEAYKAQGSVITFVQKMKDCPEEEEQALKYIKELAKK